jgi:hypothetical protein
VLGLPQGVKRTFKDPDERVSSKNGEIEWRNRPDDRKLRRDDIDRSNEEQTRTKRNRGRDEEGGSKHPVLVAQGEEPYHRLVQAQPGDEDEEPHGGQQGCCNTHVRLRVEACCDHPEEEPEPRRDEG